VTEVVKNGKGGYTITLTYSKGRRKATYTIVVAPDPKQLSFVTNSVRSNHKDVAGDIRHEVSTVAMRQLMAHLRTELSVPKRTHRVTRHERLDCAVVLSLAAHQAEGVVVKLRRGDFPRFWDLIKTLDGVIERAILSRKEFGKGEVEPDYLQIEKRKLLVEKAVEHHLAGDNRRDLFSSILTRYYSYKGGYLNKEDYEKAQALLPGFRLLWSSL
jgi:hypothetical protein